jgi:hypothetical protein
MALDGGPPLPLQEALHLVKLPSTGETRRYMGTRAAYLPGSDFTADAGVPSTHTAAFGSHVYTQAALAAAQAWRELEDERGAKPGERLDLHVCSLAVTTTETSYISVYVLFFYPSPPAFHDLPAS